MSGLETLGKLSKPSHQALVSQSLVAYEKFVP